MAWVGQVSKEGFQPGFLQFYRHNLRAAKGRGAPPRRQGQGGQGRRVGPASRSARADGGTASPGAEGLLQLGRGPEWSLLGGEEPRRALPAPFRSPPGWQP